MAERFRKNDILFLLVLSVFLLAGWIFFTFFGRKTGGVVSVTVDGQLYGTYSLSEDQTVEIRIGERTANILEIKDGRADMTKADCPDKLCVHQKAIFRERETIVCLPNKVVAEIEGGAEAELDLVT